MEEPKRNRDLAFVRRKEERLEEPHVAPLTRYVRALRANRGGEYVPWFDPDDAGVRARILLLLEAPGARSTGAAGPRATAKGSGFISADNNDRTAETIWHLYRDAGIDRTRHMVAWNIVPWYVGDEKRIRAVVDAELDEARPALQDLLALLPELRIVILLGDKAVRGWLRAQIPFPLLAAPHTSPLSLAGRPERREAVLRVFKIALREAERRPPYSSIQPNVMQHRAAFANACGGSR